MVCDELQSDRVQVGGMNTKSKIVQIARERLAPQNLLIPTYRSKSLERVEAGIGRKKKTTKRTYERIVEGETLPQLIHLTQSIYFILHNHPPSSFFSSFNFSSNIICSSM